MSLLDSLLLDPAPFNVWIAIRTDGIKGSGTASAAGSPAIDAGTSSGTGFDARGQPRTIDHPAVPNAPGSDGTDIGTLEVDPRLRAIEIRRSGENMRVRFTSVSDKIYGAEFKSNWTDSAWTPLNSTVQGTGGNATFIDPGAAAFSQRFYRIFEAVP